MSKKSNTTIRTSIKKSSELHEQICDGMGAVKRVDRKCFVPDIRDAFDDSLNIDAALLEHHRQENRWDYLLGHEASRETVAIEPHSAKEHEVNTVIKKKKAAQDQLASHLKRNARIAKWIWVASGKVHFASTEKTRLRLDQNGIQFVNKVLEKHLPRVKPKRK